MTAPVFPAFIKLEAANIDKGKSDFLQAVDQAMSAGESRTSTFAATAQSNIDRALKVPPGAASTFTAEIDRMAMAASGRLESFAASARRNLDAALSGKVTASGGIDLDVAGAREAAAVAERRAMVARQLAEATKAAALAERDFSQATRLSIAAAKELATSETAAAQAARIQADAAEKLQAAMDRAGISAKGLANANDNAKASAAQLRAGSQQLGYQISDLGTQLAMAGASANSGKMALMAFSQQTPQIIQAIGLMRGEAKGFIGFMGGPWGAALLAAGSILGQLALAHSDAADASDKQKGAAEDLTKALDDLHDATVRESRSTQASIAADIDKANSMRQRAVETRKAAIAQLEATKATLAATRDGLNIGQAGPAAGLAIQSYSNRAAELDAEIAKQTAAIAKADETIRLKRGAQIRQSVAESFDKSAAATGQYERTLDRLNSKLQAGRISEAEYRAELTRATEARNAATEATRRHSKASGERSRAAREEKAAQDALERSFYAGMKSAEAFNAELGKALGKQVEKDSARYWDSVAERQAEALGKLTAAAQAQADWNTELADTLRLLDQMGGAGSALGNLGRILGSLSGGNLGALPGRAGILGQAFGNVTWHSVDSDGNRMVHQLGDEFSRVLDKTFGEKGAFAKMLKGAGIGTAIGGIAYGNNTGAITGAGIGGALGEATFKKLAPKLFKKLGDFAGPLGSIMGGLLGGALGSVFSKVSKGYAVVTNGGVTAGGNNADLTASSRTSGTGIQAALANIADQLGGSIGNYAVSIGKRSSGWIRVSASGSSAVADKSFAKRGGSDLLYNGKDEAEALRVALLNALQDGAIKGIREGSQRLLKAGGDIETALRKALSFEGVFRDLKQIKDPVGSALDAVNLEFRRLIDVFKEAGASSAEYAQLEELYGIKRADAVRDANERILGSLKGLKEFLGVNSDFYSLRDRQAQAQAIYNPLKARVQAGDATAFDAFSKAAQDLLEIERQINGSTGAFYARADEIKALTDQAIAGKEAQAAAASASDSPFTQLATQQQATTSAIDNQTQALIAALGGRLDAINDNLVTSVRAQLSAAAANGSTSLAMPARGYF